MGDLSAHFSRSEFRCLCKSLGKCEEEGYCGGRLDTPVNELVRVLESLREHFGAIYGACRIEISGPLRCAKHNADEGGVDHSEHVFAKAVDVKVWIVATQKQVSPGDVAVWLEKQFPDQYGIGRYANRTHVDVRQGKARWRAE